MISSKNLICHLGRDSWPLVLDIRNVADVKKTPRFLPCAKRIDPQKVATVVSQGCHLPYVVYEQCGNKDAAQAAETLCRAGVRAVYLEGGLQTWLEQAGPTVGPQAPALAKLGGSRWITRAQPKIDRIACPWLIHRFLDPKAEIFYVEPDTVVDQGRRLAATPFDIPKTRFSHQGKQCSFDAFIKVFDIQDPVLDELALTIRGADTARLDLAPECAGLLAVSLGLSALYPADQEMLTQGMTLYDAFYARIRFAGSERHNWPSPGVAGTAS